EPVADSGLAVAVRIVDPDLVGVVDRQIDALREGPAIAEVERDQEPRPVLRARAVIGVALVVEPVVEADRRPAVLGPRRRACERADRCRQEFLDCSIHSLLGHMMMTMTIPQMISRVLLTA